MPYKLDPNYVYMFGRRGDIKSNDSKVVGQRDGMIGYIDAQDWFGKDVWLSDFTMKRMFIARCPRAWKTKLTDAVKGSKDIKGNDIPKKGYIDYASFSSLKTVDGNTINAPESIIHTPNINPVWNFDKQSLTDIKDATKRDWKKTIATLDFNTVAAGSFTVGGGADDYPTFGDAGGAVADIGTPQTGDLTFTQTTAITETAQASTTGKNTGAFKLLFDSTPHLGDPTAGLLISINNVGALGQWMYINNQYSNAGNVEIKNLYTKCVGDAVTDVFFITRYVGGQDGTGIVNMHDCLIDGNDLANVLVSWQYTQYLDTVLFSNNNGWDADGAQGYGLSTGNAGFVVSRIENNNMYSCKTGFQLQGKAHLMQNNTADGTASDFVGINGATGNTNSSADSTAADGNWAAGSGNLSGVVTSGVVLSLDDTNSDFFNINPIGEWAGSGTANTLTRDRDIRNNLVPNDSGTTSIGVADLPTTFVGSGTYYVGTTGDYTTWHNAVRHIDDLSGDLTFTQVTDVTEVSETLLDICNLNTYSLTFNSDDPHYGNPNSGYLTSSTISGADLFNFSIPENKAWNLIIENLRMKATAGNIDSFININSTVNPTSGTFKLYNLLLDANSNVGDAIRAEVGTAGRVEFKNINIWDSINAGIDIANMSGVDIVENCNVYNCGVYGFIGNSGQFFNNCIGIDNPSGDFSSHSFDRGSTNVSSDNTANNGEWAYGYLNISGADVGIWKSTNDTSSNFMKLMFGNSSIRNSGSPPILSNNTNDIWNNDRPHTAS